jgi:type IV pilus assembly protein PilA
MNRKGFTLVEVLIVVIIIGILAAIGIPQFAASIEKAKGGEARAGLGHIQTAEKVYFAEYEAYLPIVANEAVESLDLSSSLDIVLTQKYWVFEVAVPGTNEDGAATLYTATATRRTSGLYLKMDNTGAVWGDWE